MKDFFPSPWKVKSKFTSDRDIFSNGLVGRKPAVHHKLEHEENTPPHFHHFIHLTYKILERFGET